MILSASKVSQKLQWFLSISYFLIGKVILISFLFRKMAEGLPLMFLLVSNLFILGMLFVYDLSLFS